MRNGICPKCRSKNIYMRKNGIQVGENSGGVFVHTSTMTRVTPIEAYICVDCGYFENFITDAAKLMEVSQTWTKVEPMAFDMDDL